MCIACTCNKAWVEAADDSVPTYREVVGIDDEEQEIEEQEKFEQRHNFRSASLSPLPWVLQLAIKTTLLLGVAT